MHQLSQFLETKEKKQVRVPMPPEVPESLRSCGTDISVCPSACFNPTQSYDHRCHQRLHADQFQWMRQIFCEQRDQGTGKRQISQRHPLECSARRPRLCYFPRDPMRDSLFLCFEAGRTLVTSSGTSFGTPSERCFISSIVLSLHIIHLGFTRPTTCIRRSRPAAFSSLRYLCSLCVSALYSPFLPNLESATCVFARYSQAHSMDSLPQAVLPPPSTSDHSSCRHMRSIFPGRVATPQPAASLRALSLPRTWLHLKRVPSTCRSFLLAALQAHESSP